MHVFLIVLKIQTRVPRKFNFELVAFLGPAGSDHGEFMLFLLKVRREAVEQVVDVFLRVRSSTTSKFVWQLEVQIRVNCFSNVKIISPELLIFEKFFFVFCFIFLDFFLIDFKCCLIKAVIEVIFFIILRIIPWLIKVWPIEIEVVDVGNVQ